jgi:multiple sugar transport system permease protein/raffinose/stachyose/melibiose transport system permease protein
MVLLYLLPALIFITVFFIFPLIFTLPVSLVKWDGIGAMKFIGLSNFVYLWKDSYFRIAIINTVYWILAGTFIHTPLGLLVALLLYKRPRGWAFHRTLIFLPNILSAASLALLWFFLLNPTFGLINHLLEVVGLKSLVKLWLVDPKTALISTQIPFMVYIGFTMLIFLAQISTIPKECYEAAEIDGASKFQQDLYITIPLIRRAIAINILFNAAFCLKMIEYPLIMTSGGPAGVTLTLPLYMYQQMTIARSYGLTMATGFVTIIMGMIVMGLIFLGLSYFDKRLG